MLQWRSPSGCCFWLGLLERRGGAVRHTRRRWHDGGDRPAPPQFRRPKREPSSRRRPTGPNNCPMRGSITKAKPQGPDRPSAAYCPASSLGRRVSPRWPWDRACQGVPTILAGPPRPSPPVRHAHRDRGGRGCRRDGCLSNSRLHCHLDFLAPGSRPFGRPRPSRDRPTGVKDGLVLATMRGRQRLTSPATGGRPHVWSGRCAA